MCWASHSAEGSGESEALRRGAALGQRERAQPGGTPPGSREGRRESYCMPFTWAWASFFLFFVCFFLTAI